MALTKVTYSMIDGASVNVFDYGATGDGVTDDTAAINAALAYLESVGGGTLYFPFGTYYITDSIENQTNPSASISLQLIGEAATVINCNPTVYSNGAISLIYNALNTVLVQNLTVQCNSKTARGITIQSTGDAIDVAIVSNCQIYDVNAVNNAGVTSNVHAIGIYSTGWGYNASVTDCVAYNVTRAKTALACQGIVVSGMQNSLVSNNSVYNVRHSGIAGDKTDADGIVVFSQSTAGNYQKSSATIINNSIRQCEGRFVKLQTNGSSVVENNLMSNSGSIELIDNFTGVDSQTGDSTIANNTVEIGTGWTGGVSAKLFALQSPTLTNQDYANEGFFQRLLNNNVEVRKTIPYFCVPEMPVAGVTANFYVEIANNTCNFPTTLNTATQTDIACSAFVYVGSGPSVANTNGQVVWKIYGNTAFTYNFIRFDYTQADYTNKWYFYVYDNFKPSIGYSREIFYNGPTSPYTSTCMIRDNQMGSVNGYMTWPIDFSKVFDGTDFYSGTQTMTSVPVAYTNSRCYKKGGMWGVQRSNQWYISGDASSWTALV